MITRGRHIGPATSSRRASGLFFRLFFFFILTPLPVAHEPARCVSHHVPAIGGRVESASHVRTPKQYSICTTLSPFPRFVVLRYVDH